MNYISTYSQVHIDGQVQITDKFTTINPYSLLDVQSDSMAMILPVMSSSSRDSISPVEVGMMIYNKDERKYQAYDIDQSQSNTLACCTSPQLVTGNFNETYGLKLTTPNSGPIERIRLRYFFNGSTPDSIRLVIASTPQSTCTSSENILSYTNKVPATSGWNTYTPDDQVILNANDVIYIWPEQINEALVKLRYNGGGGNNSRIAMYDHLNCITLGSDPHVELRQTITTFSGWVDLH